MKNRSINTFIYIYIIDDDFEWTPLRLPDIDVLLGKTTMTLKDTEYEDPSKNNNNVSNRKQSNISEASDHEHDEFGDVLP